MLPRRDEEITLGQFASSRITGSGKARPDGGHAPFFGDSQSVETPTPPAIRN
jgi:hypothetical protein